MKSKSKSRMRMRGGSPAYDHHVAEGFLNQPSTHLSNMPLTNIESGPVENYANLYQISGGGRTRRRGNVGRRRPARRGREQRGCKGVVKRRSLSSSKPKRHSKKKIKRKHAARNIIRSKRCGCRKYN